MGRFIDRTGTRKGRLSIVKYLGRDSDKNHIWECLCDCGNRIIRTSQQLTDRAKSCGCLRKEFLCSQPWQLKLTEDRVDTILRKLYSQIKKRHRKLGFESGILVFDEFKRLSLERCYYCNRLPQRKVNDYTNVNGERKILSDTVVHVNGIDRVDSGIGYVYENCVPCCPDCNFAKHTMTRDGFMDLVRRIYETHFANSSKIE